MMYNTVVRRRFWISLTLSTLALIWLFAGYMMDWSLPKLLQSARLGERATRNRTLGFGEIFMAILPARTDQRDAATLLSYYSDIDLTIVDGVTNVSRKAVPGNTRGRKVTDAELGCWRVHMNMLRMVVEKRLETALILEGDVDWDIRVKDQFTRLSDHLPDSTAQHPYGFSWLFFWFGHCDHAPDPKKKGPIVVYPDETVGSMKDQHRFVKEESQYYNVTGYGKRIISPAFKPLCTTSYAVTFEGALRMLYEIGWNHLDQQVDEEYRKATVAGRLPGLSVTPPLMSQWKIGTAADSDIQDSQALKIWRSWAGLGSGPQVRQSARKQLRINTYANTKLGWAHA